MLSVFPAGNVFSLSGFHTYGIVILEALNGETQQGVHEPTLGFAAGREKKGGRGEGGALGCLLPRVLRYLVPVTIDVARGHTTRHRFCIRGVSSHYNSKAQPFIS